MLSIRQASIDDLPRLEECAREFYASSEFLTDFRLERFVEAWTGLLANDIGVIFLLVDDGEILGALGGVRYPDLYSGSLIASEFFWFVRQQYRGKGLKLYRVFELWAKATGCTQIRMVHLTDSMPAQLDSTYRRLGFKPAEVHYTKEIV